MDSDDFGSADDDCDVIGDNLTVSWNRSGTHKLVYHVTDDDGAHSSEVLEVLVLNTRPSFAPLRFHAWPISRVCWMQQHP